MARPRNPAPVSGPGGLSQRTDGGPGQKVRVAPAEYHGQRQELESQQQAAPLASSSPLPPGGAAAGLQPNDPKLEELRSGLWAPRAPGAPRPVSGLGPGEAAQLTAETALRALYQQFPHPDIGRLLPRE